MKKEQRLAVVFMRAQPPHMGHEWLLKKAIDETGRLLVILGSVNVHNDKNPLPAIERERLIREMAIENDWGSSFAGVEQLKDMSDEEWVAGALEVIRKYEKDLRSVVVYGDNEWVNGLMEKEGIQVERVGFFERDIYEGTKIRQQRTMGDENWLNAIPAYLRRLLLEFNW